MRVSYASGGASHFNKSRQYGANEGGRRRQEGGDTSVRATGRSAPPAGQWKTHGGERAQGTSSSWQRQPWKLGRLAKAGEREPREPYPDDGRHPRKTVADLVDELRSELRRLRIRDKKPGTSTGDWHARNVARLKTILAQINRRPGLLAKTRSDFLSTPKADAALDTPILVSGVAPPLVTVSAVWLRPDGRLDLALSPAASEAVQRHGKSTSATRPTLSATVERLTAIIVELQRCERKRPNRPSPAGDIAEAKDLIETANSGMADGSWDRNELKETIRAKMGRDGKLWCRSPPTDDKTYVQIGENDKFSLALRKQPEDAVASRETKATQDDLHERSNTKHGGDESVPLSVPYTTAASVFIYGANSVLAALRAHRRKLYQLYVHPRLTSRSPEVSPIQNIATELGVPIENDVGVRLLDKMSDNRPHNGVVLEASRLPAPPLLSLGRSPRGANTVPLVLGHQSAEDAAINESPTALPILPHTWRHPFVLMLDGITDPGNVGNILRTAHFYGVDAVVVATNTCAPLTSAPLVKASSGACEALRIFALPKPSDFVYDSAKVGWHVYAAVAPPAHGPSVSYKHPTQRPTVNTSALAQRSPLAGHPVILMLGAEGEGLRANLMNKASHFVTIEQGSRARDGEAREDIGVDSLNVGVAAGVLVEAFMRKPEGAVRAAKTSELGF